MRDGWLGFLLPKAGDGTEFLYLIRKEEDGVHLTHAEACQKSDLRVSLPTTVIDCITCSSSLRA